MASNSRKTMLHIFSFYFVLTFICSYCQLCTADQLYTKENTIQFVLDVYPKLCENNAATHYGNLTKEQSELLMLLQNLSTDYHDPKVMISDKIIRQINDSKMMLKLNALLEHMRNIQSYYDEFLDIFVNYREYPPKSLQDFIDTTTSPSSVEFKSIVDELQETFNDIWTQNIINRIDTRTEEPYPICLENRSLQQLLHEFSRAVATAHIKGLFVILHSYCMQEKIDNRSYAVSKESVINKYKRKIIDNLERIKHITENVSREVLRCDPAEFKNGETYSKLDSVFQAHFTYENRPLFKLFSSSVCDSITYDTFQCTQDRCKNQPENKKCRGTLRNCQSTNNNMKFCIAPAESRRRYDWMKTESDAVFGHHYTTGCNDIRSVEGSRFTSDVCLCNCESEDIHTARYFSLQNVTSDVDENKVITGVRWVKKESVFYIQIQQGILDAKGSIRNNSVEWKAIDSKWSINQNYSVNHNYSVHHNYSVNKNYSVNNNYSVNHDHSVHHNHSTHHNHTTSHNKTVSINNIKPVSLETLRDSKHVYAVTSDTNTIYLDDFDSQKGKLITGLRLQRVGNDLRLEIQETPFNFTSGKLDGKASNWTAKSDNTSRRTEVQLKNPDEPIRMATDSKIKISQSNQFVRFTMTDLQKDLGQHTVPYIDLREVVTNPPTPLAGLGIFHKGQEGYGGFLALKIMHYNFAYYS